MKRPGFLLSVMMILTCIIISCNKNSDNSEPVQKKPYAWIAGEKDSTGYGMILFSADSGETWVRQGLGTTALKDIDVNDIWAVDENVVWAVCSSNVVLKTQDGGKTWTRMQPGSTRSSPRLSCISIVNRSNIWISGSGGTVYNSIDNGVTWIQFDTTFFHNGLMQGIWAITPLKVYVVGGIDLPQSRGFIAYTLDGGVNWDTISPVNDYNRHEWIGVTALGGTIVVYGGRAHYMVSTDGGLNWKNDSVLHTGGILGADVNHLIMLNTQTWWGAFDLGEIFITTDGGINWTSQPTNSGGEYLVGIDAWDNQLALAVGMAASFPKRCPILRYSHAGSNWEVIKIFSSNLYKVTFVKQ